MDKDANAEQGTPVEKMADAGQEIAVEQVINPVQEPDKEQMTNPVMETNIIHEANPSEKKTSETKPDTADKKRSGKKLFSIGIPVLAVLIIAAGLFFGKSNAVIESQDGKFYRSKVVLTGFSIIVQLRDAVPAGSYDAAKSSSNSLGFSFAKISSVKKIHFADEAASVSSAGNESPVQGNNPFDIRFIGKYKVNVAGHPGFLYLSVKNGYLFGGLQFPGWGNGVYEPLKQLSIRGYAISFVRSATTPDELRKTGAGTYFTQKYSGEYSKDGKFISGIYTSTGTRQNWKAERM